MFPKLKRKNCALIVLGSIIQAVGIYQIHAQSAVTEGGVLGLTLLLWQWLDLSPAVTSLLLNGVCYAIGWRTLGGRFIAYSALSILCYSGTYRVCECFPPIWPEIGNYPLLAAVLGALFIGVGAGICVRCGGATGGDDALAMSVHALTGMPVQRFYLMDDLAVLLASLSYIPVERIAYSLLTVVLSGQIIGMIQNIPQKEDPEWQ